MDSESETGWARCSPIVPTTRQLGCGEMTCLEAPWFHTDDTEMAVSLVGVLKSHGCVHQSALSKRLVRRFERDPERGYGKMTRIQLVRTLPASRGR